MEQHATFANVSSFLPSPADLLMAVPRLLARAGALGEHIDSVFGKIRSGGTIIAEPTVANLTNATTATAAGRFVQESVAAAAAHAGLAFQDDMNLFQALKNVGSFFSYITSKWAIATFSIVKTPATAQALPGKHI
jgi:S-adenosylmethionine:tRNA-ribosyltransferase-isomerase (queuine synthetase)